LCACASSVASIENKNAARAGASFRVLLLVSRTNDVQIDKPIGKNLNFLGFHFQWQGGAQRQQPSSPIVPNALGVQKPIRIIVKNGHVTLEGVVDSEADKNLVGLRANSVPGILSVTNNLQVVPPN
jgi:hypothetical protein